MVMGLIDLWNITIKNSLNHSREKYAVTSVTEFLQIFGVAVKNKSNRLDAIQ